MVLVAERLESAHAFIPNLRVVSPDLVRGGHPDPGGLSTLKDAGISTIICLSGGGSGLVGLMGGGRSMGENRETQQERAQADKLGMKFISIPLDVFSAPPMESIELFISTISQDEHRPAFVHCLHGRDRTGLITAVYRVVFQNWTADKAYAEMLECGFDMSRTNLSDALFYVAKQRTAGRG
jgi:protein tyrosine/serine phosphatase